jgi:hypothetical protein
LIAILAVEQAENVLLDYWDELRTVEVLAGGNEVEVEAEGQLSTENGIVFHHELMDELEHVHTAERWQLYR